MLVTLLLVQTFAAPDSAAIRRDAVAAQAAFERTRRHHLPLTSSGFRCEVQLGRFCYWYDESEPLAAAGARTDWRGARPAADPAG
jgi:hypothetical protein